MIRDEELNRLIRYAQGMGLSVRFKPYVPYSSTAASWTTDGTELTVYTSPKDSKIDMILSLIHELGHHKAFIKKNRKIDPKIDKALDDDSKKKHRKLILEYEREDTQYWEEIYKDTNCQFNINKLYKQRELDIWIYEVFYEYGEFPTQEEQREKRIELTKKYKVK